MINVRQEVGENWGRMVAVEIGTLVVNTGPEDLFDRIVRAPLEALTRDQLTAPVTILVDALDESLAYTGSLTIAELVAQAGGLPEAVRFVVTSRPRSELVRSMQRRSAQQYTLSPGRAEAGGPPDAYAQVLQDVQTTSSGCCGTRSCPADWPRAWRRRSSSLRSATRARETSSTSATSCR